MTDEGEAKIDPKMLFGPRGSLLTKQATGYVKATGPLGRGIDRQPWVYAGGVWKPGEREIHERVVALLGDQYKPGHLAAITSYIMGDATLPMIESNPVGQWLNFGNGLYDWGEDKLYAHTERVLSTVQLGVQWNPSATCANWLAFLGQVVPADSVPFMQELFGYFMFSGNPYEKAFMFFGTGRNGKGTVLQVLENLLGKENVSHVRLQQLSSESHRFAKADLYGRLANVAGDLDPTMMRETGEFKEVVGNDEVRAEHKGMRGFDFKPFAKHLFSANVIPSSADVSSGYMEKWVVIDFPNQFLGDTADPGLKKRLTERDELEGVAAWAVEGLRRLMKRGNLSLPPSMLEAKRRFELAVDPVRGFLYDAASKPDPVGASVAVSAVYPVYAAWCDMQGRPKLGKHKLNERLESIPGVRRVRRDGVETFVGFSLVADAMDFVIQTTSW